MTQSIGYRWKLIEDLPQDCENLESKELRSLANVWAEEKDNLDADDLERFNERLKREWAIETGVVERVYTLDRGITRLLIERGVDASLIPHGSTDKTPETVAAMIRDHQESLEALFEFVVGQRPFSTGFVNALHAVLVRNQESVEAIDALGRRVEVEILRGEYKRLPNNPVKADGTLHEYCPPEHVAAEMDRLVKLHLAHREVGVPPEVESAWFHHRFSQIHPFQDGNGRVARCLASLVFIREGWFPLVITRDDRVRYLDALEKADGGDLAELVRSFAAAQRRAFVNALGLARSVRLEVGVHHVIDAALDSIRALRVAKLRRWEGVKGTAKKLQDLASKRLEEVCLELKTKIGAFDRSYDFWEHSERDGSDKDHYFKYQIIQTARRLRYFANTATYRAWNRIVLRKGGQAEIVISFHGIGHSFRGVLAASACFFRREEMAEQERQIVDIQPLSEEIFQFNYAEDSMETCERFSEWLEPVLIKGLEMWRTGL